jgi:hypothetical protein
MEMERRGGFELTMLKKLKGATLTVWYSEEKEVTKAIGLGITEPDKIL